MKKRSDDDQIIPQQEQNSQIKLTDKKIKQQQKSVSQFMSINQDEDNQIQQMKGFVPEKKHIQIKEKQYPQQLEDQSNIQSMNRENKTHNVIVKPQLKVDVTRNIDNQSIFSQNQSPVKLQKDSFIQTKKDSNSRFNDTIKVTDNVIRGMFQTSDQDYTLKRVKKKAKRYEKKQQQQQQQQQSHQPYEPTSQISKKNYSKKLPPLQQLTSIEILKEKKYNFKQQQKLKQQTIIGSNITADVKTKIRCSDVDDVGKFITQVIPQRKYFQCTFIRNKQGINMLYPQYNLIMYQDNKYFGSAKKMSCQATSTYALSSDPSNFKENSQHYFGFVKSNFLGTIFNVFNLQDNKIPIATISYQAKCIDNVRSVQIYMINQNLQIGNLDGIEAGLQKNLKDLYQIEQNKYQKKIIKLVNRKPEWNATNKNYELDFRGKAQLSSVKNMIIIDEEKPDKDILVIGKRQDHQFNLYLTNPISIHVALGFLISSFDFKWASQ